MAATNSSQAQLKSKKRFTSIGELFKVEIMFVRLCAGFMFEPPADRGHPLLWRLLIITYRLCLVVGTRILAVRFYIIKPQMSDSIPKATWQNIELFWTASSITSLVTLLGTVITGVRYQNILLIILKKRFDSRYLRSSWLDNTNEDLAVDSTLSTSSASSVASNQSQSSLSRDNQTPSSAISSTSGSSGGSSGGSSSKQLICATKRGPTTDLCQSVADQWNWQKKITLEVATRGVLSEFKQLDSSSLNKEQTSRVRLLRFLIGFNFLFTAATKFVTFELSLLVKARRLKQLQAALNGTTTSTITTTMTTSTMSTLFELNNNNINTSLSETQTGASPYRGQQMSYNQLVAVGLAFSTRALAVAGRLLMHLANSALNINQVYGQVFVTLMITATIADMLHESIQRDHMRHLRGPLKTDSNRPTGRPLLTTELLIQIRDTLVALRKAMSLDYLLLMLYDMSRLMNTFCLFSSFMATERVSTAALIFVEYLRIAFSIFLTRIGYHWLHMEVRKLRLINERKILETAANVNELRATSSSSPVGVAYLTSTPSSWSAKSADSSAAIGATQSLPTDNNNRHRPVQANLDISKAEATTTFRLAHEIENLWPTDWFTPDLKSYLTQNFFVITFVATLQQLVEASTKVEYQASQMGAGRR